MSDQARIFIGIELSGYFVDVIPMIKSTIIDKKDSIRWINGRNLHLTLSFIGSIDKTKLDMLEEKMSSISSFNSFDIIVNGTGTFPEAGSPKIFWLDIKKGSQTLLDLHSKINNISETFKQNKKNEDFIPHITIGRSKDFNKNLNFDLSIFSNAVYSDIKIPIKSICLFKSELTEGGANYSVISKYLLK